MLAVRSIEATQEKYVRNSIRVYFEGTRNLRWIVGVIDGAKAQARVTSKHGSANTRKRKPTET